MPVRLLLLIAFWIAALAPLAVLAAWIPAGAGEAAAAMPAAAGRGAFVVAILAALAIGGVLAHAMALPIRARQREWAFVLAQASHDLRTPLGALLCYAELMARPDLSPPGTARREAYLGDIQDCGAHMLALIEGLDAFGRAEAGAGALAEEVFATQELLGAAALLVAPQAERRGIAVVVDPGGVGTMLRGDRHALRRALGNLLANAVAYTHAGDRVVLSVGRDPDGSVELVVADHGPGIPQAELAQIAEPFRRGGAEVARGSQGSGLGLAIVSAIAKAHGGALRLASAPGEGVRAAIVLPRARMSAGL